MKNLKSILVIAVLFIGMQGAFGQGFGIRAGLNMSNLNGEQNNIALKYELLPGFHAGINYEIPFSSAFYLQPGVLFTTKGGQLKDVDAKLVLNYIEVPVNFVYKPTLGSGKLIAGFGPYIAYGIGGSHEWASIADKSPFGDSPRFNPLDLGGNLLFGYMFAQGLELQFNAGLGLMDIDRNDNDRHANTQFGVSLGYRF